MNAYVIASALSWRPCERMRPLPRRAACLRHCVHPEFEGISKPFGWCHMRVSINRGPHNGPHCNMILTQKDSSTGAPAFWKPPHPKPQSSIEAFSQIPIKEGTSELRPAWQLDAILHALQGDSLVALDMIPLKGFEVPFRLI